MEVSLFTKVIEWDVIKIEDFHFNRGFHKTVS